MVCLGIADLRLFRAAARIVRNMHMSLQPTVTRDMSAKDDIVPRASLAQFEDLRKAIIATNWAEKLKAEV